LSTLDYIHQRLDKAELQLRRLISTLTIPVYDPSNMPQDAVEGQIAVGIDNSFNWFTNNSWHTQPGLPTVSINAPQEGINGEVVVTSDHGLAWYVNGAWYGSGGVPVSSGNPPQDSISGQIAIGNDGILCWHSRGTWYTFGEGGPQVLYSGVDGTDITYADRFTGDGRLAYVPNSPVQELYTSFEIYIPSSSAKITHNGYIGNIIYFHEDETTGIRNVPYSGTVEETLYIENDSGVAHDVTQWYIGSLYGTPYLNDPSIAPLALDTWHEIQSHVNVNTGVQHKIDGNDWDFGGLDSSFGGQFSQIAAVSLGLVWGVGSIDHTWVAFRNFKVGSTGWGSSDLLNDPLDGSQTLDAVYGHDNWTPDEWWTQGLDATYSRPHTGYPYIRFGASPA